MAPRKRKSPKGKGKRQQSGLASRSAMAMGTLGLRGAGLLGGATVRGAGPGLARWYLIASTNL